MGRLAMRRSTAVAALALGLAAAGTAPLGAKTLVTMNTVQIFGTIDPAKISDYTDSFMDIEANRGDGAYQLWQAILAFAAGGVDGVGLGQGRQQNSFLPEAHTDFIFAIMGEEMGLIFTLLVVALFVTIFVAGLMHVRRAPNLFQFLLVTGSLLLICLQAIINLGVVTGMLPTKGMSLPFISAELDKCITQRLCQLSPISRIVSA